MGAKRGMIDMSKEGKTAVKMELPEDLLVLELKCRPNGRNTTWEDGDEYNRKLLEEHPELKTKILSSGTVVVTLTNGENPLDVEEILNNRQGRLSLECQERRWDKSAAVVCGLQGEELDAYFVARQYHLDGISARFSLAWTEKLGLTESLLILADRRVAEPSIWKLGLKVEGANVKIAPEKWTERKGLDSAIERAKSLASGISAGRPYAKVANPKPIRPRYHDYYDPYYHYPDGYWDLW